MNPTSHIFPNNQTLAPAQPAFADNLRDLAAFTLECTKKHQVTDAEIELSASVGQAVTVRMNDVETIEYNRDKGLSVTVYMGKQRGNASTSDLSREAIERTVAAACAIAKYTAPDEFAGLADPALFAKGKVPDLGLYRPWTLSVEEAIEIAKRTEAAAFAVDRRISNSEGASVSTHESDFVYANSAGFMDGYPTSRCSLSCAVIASSDMGMQRDYWYSVARGEAGVEPAEQIGKRAGERCIARLNARKIATCTAPVLFDATVASGLIGAFVGAVSGSSLYRKSSFLLDSLGKEIFTPIVSIREEPHLIGGLASAPFDSEGVATVARDIVKNGVLQGYFLGSYSARKLGMQTTGNAGGNHNLLVAPGSLDFAGLLKKMDRGLVVTELMGQGVNTVTGDYSHGAVGFWVEDGAMAYPVEEFTIAGNLKEMFRNIVAVGNDVLALGSKQVGSILIGKMAIAGE